MVYLFLHPYGKTAGLNRDHTALKKRHQAAPSFKGRSRFFAHIGVRQKAASLSPTVSITPAPVNGVMCSRLQIVNKSDFEK